MGSHRRPDITEETSPHRSRPGDSWARGRGGGMVDCGKGGDTVRDECRPLPCVRNLEKASAFPRQWERQADPTRPPHAALPGVTGGHSKWQHLETPGPGARLLLWAVVLLLLTRQAPLSVPHKPAWQGGGQTGGSQAKAQPRGQLGPRATNHSVFISPHRLHRSWGCLPGRQGGAGVGTPSHLLLDRPLPSILGVGRVGHTL